MPRIPYRFRTEQELEAQQEFTTAAGTVLKRIRVNSGLKLDEVGAELNVAASTIGNLERGAVAIIDLYRVVRMLGFYQVEVGRFLTSVALEIVRANQDKIELFPQNRAPSQDELGQAE